MTLNRNPSHPLTHSYVLKLHRDAARRGEIVGRLENMLSGRSCDFLSGAQLLACLANDGAMPEADARPDHDLDSAGSNSNGIARVIRRVVATLRAVLNLNLFPLRWSSRP